MNYARLASLATVYTMEKPFATEYSLACITLPKDPEFADMAIKCLRDDLFSGKLRLNVEYRPQGAPPAVTLENENHEDIIKNLVADGFLLVEKRREKRLSKLVGICTSILRCIVPISWTFMEFHIIFQVIRKSVNLFYFLYNSTSELLW